MLFLCPPVHSWPSVGVVLGQRRRLFVGIEMGCDTGPTLNRNWVGTSVFCRDTRITIYWQVSNWLLASTGDSDGMNRHWRYILLLVSLVLSLIISWTFRILAHEEDQHNFVHKILGRIFVHSIHTAWSRASEFGTPFLVFYWIFSCNHYNEKLRYKACLGYYIYHVPSTGNDSREME